MRRTRGLEITIVAVLGLAAGLPTSEAIACSIAYEDRVLIGPVRAANGSLMLPSNGALLVPSYGNLDPAMFPFHGVGLWPASDDDERPELSTELEVELTRLDEFPGISRLTPVGGFEAGLNYWVGYAGELPAAEFHVEEAPDLSPPSVEVIDWAAGIPRSCTGFEGPIEYDPGVRYTFNEFDEPVVVLRRAVREGTDHWAPQQWGEFGSRLFSVHTDESFSGTHEFVALDVGGNQSEVVEGPDAVAKTGCASDIGAAGNARGSGKGPSSLAVWSALLLLSIRRRALGVAGP